MNVGNRNTAVAYHIAEAVMNKYTSVSFLEDTTVSKELVEEANEELKRELIKREIEEGTVALVLEEGFGHAPNKISIKFGALMGNKEQVTFYNDVMQ